MHAKRIRNLLTAVLLTGAVFGNTGSVKAEEVPDMPASVSLSSSSEGEEETDPGEDTEERSPELGTASEDGSDAGDGTDCTEADNTASGSETDGTEESSSSSDTEGEKPYEGDGSGASGAEDTGAEAEADSGTEAEKTDGEKTDGNKQEAEPESGESVPDEKTDKGLPDEEKDAADPEGAAGPAADEETDKAAEENEKTREAEKGTEGGSLEGAFAADADLPIRSGTGARIVRHPVTSGDFRFWTVAKVYAFARRDADILVEKDRRAAKAGALEEGGLCFVIHDEEDGWLYVESGEVRGFVRSVLLEVEEDEKKADARIKKAELSNGREDGGLFARPLMDRNENTAFAYIRATTDEVVSDKDYALPSEPEVPVFDEKSEEGKRIGLLKDGDLSYILLKEGPWCYIESGDVRGFAKADLLNTDAEEEIREKGEESFGSADLLVAPSDNRALYYTLRSVKSGTPDGEIRESVVSYASQFIGNPYVWGGTDPVNGADCSGFVQTIYGKYGYELPRVAADQAGAGLKVPVSEAREGDLLFSMDESGDIYHVAICAGDGKTVEAANSEVGIIEGSVSPDACWAVRIIDDGERNEIPEEYEGHPVGSGTCYTVTHHYGERNWGYACREVSDLWKEAGGIYTENCATLDGKYLIACTSLFGTVGDHITWYFDDGSHIESVMADTKSSGDANYTPWGHITGSGIINVIEFETDELINPGREGCFPDLKERRAVAWVNHGSILPG